MKRFLFFIFLLITNWYGMLAQNDAMLIYRNDGIVHGFLKADIDSVRHSQLDLDSVMHKDFVVQEVWTADSVYRIPLEVIDSVSFVLPPTVFKQGVVNLKEQLLDYVIGADGLTLKLKANVPNSLIPSAGDKIVLLDGCRSLPNGFSGIVQNIQTTTEGVEVICERAYMEDLFDSFCSVSTLYVSGGEQAQAKYITARGASTRADFGTSKWGTLTISCASQILPNVFPDSDLALQLGAEASIAVTPKLRIHAFTILGDGNGFYFNGSVTGNLEVASKLALYGSIDYNKDFTDPKLEKGIAIPGTACLVDYYFAPGFFVHANATISESVTDVRNFQIGMNFDYSSIGENVLKPVPPTLRLVSSSTEMEGCIDGSLAAGIFVEKGFNIWSRGVGKVCCRGELGMQVSGNFVLRNSDIDNSEGTELYERIKKTSIEAGPYANLQLQASILGIGPSVTLSERSNFKKWDLVPTFSNTQLSRVSGSVTSAQAYTQLSGKCLFPISVGYKLYDGNRNEVADYTASVAYRDKECKFEHIFSNLDANRDYTVYPKVSLFGHDLLASPSADLEKAKKSIVKITNFKQTDSEYSKNGFSNDCMTYDYKFDVAVTVEIDNIDGVADWGYVYKEPNGNIKRISLMQYVMKYTDTRYSYYRNEAKSTVCLYGYVRYVDDAEYYDSEPCNYNLSHAELLLCPDENHPHAIDLGLPSGTKWACCNVGASSPEESGGYFAWGETMEKSSYTFESYVYKYIDSEGDGHFVDIGKEIAGTSYDVAYVRMKGKWRMPSKEQLGELLTYGQGYCSRMWIQLNGVNGLLFTGANGAQIFLPAAGERIDYDGLYGEDTETAFGSYGWYYSSSLAPLFSDGDFWGPVGLKFSAEDSNWFQGGSREAGLSVRAICP